MASLHIINASSERRAALENCLRAASPGDTVLLVGNGVFWAVASMYEDVAKRASDITCIALAADVASRGIGHLVTGAVKQVDDGAFVDLVVTHHPIVSWS
jgi:sulfur relay protein TusB/DsrH